MLLSIAIILLSGLLLGTICKKVRFPSLFGMIIAGVIIGPYCLNLIDDSILNVSSEIRRIALIIILIRAGLKLSLDDLKKVGRPAILMCFLPACFEIIGMIIIAPIMESPSAEIKLLITFATARFFSPFLSSFLMAFSLLFPHQ